MTCKLLWKDQRGADVIEYALLVCQAALVCVASFAPLAEATAETETRIAEMLSAASGAVKPVRSASASAPGPTRAQASPPAPMRLQDTGRSTRFTWRRPGQSMWCTVGECTSVKRGGRRRLSGWRESGSRISRRAATECSRELCWPAGRRRSAPGPFRRFRAS
jgi:Flp pilus assembly pilin Flp